MKREIVELAPLFLVCQTQISLLFCFLFTVLVYLIWLRKLVSGNEFCELLALFGIGGNLVTYLTMKLHEGNVLGARNVTTWLGTCHLTPLIGAVMADAYWGRYRTIACFSIIHFMVRFILHKRKKNSLFVAYSYSVISPFIPDSFSWNN